MRPRFTRMDIRNYMAPKVRMIEDAIIDQMKQVGELFVTNARSTRTYTDRTRNLRGSIGYVILRDGRVIFGDYNGNSEGARKAQRLVSDARSDYSKGFVLICFAGMQYAAFVEAKGFDVITGSTIEAETDLKTAFRKILNKTR